LAEFILSSNNGRSLEKAQVISVVPFYGKGEANISVTCCRSQRLALLLEYCDPRIGDTLQAY
jgi:hypothetical protein